ncbi:hypothetical protein OCF84_20705 (plasmid) [Shewanella xiamenensis]|uniref:secretion/conjugation apparatus DotM-related subunit n=1 Tax=Shewanella xiamenensis TaxID=332186 RepID=UPI0024AD4862|nr:hypothetical protein [Shewanella xiamenensis]WHF57939.1 hypothetical protein OCF84_20705 [Shewanella xiamenensis]
MTRKGVLNIEQKKFKINNFKLLDDCIEVIGEQYQGIKCLNRDELVLMAGLTLIAGNKPFYRGFKGLFYNIFGNFFFKNMRSIKAMDVAVGLFGDMSECYNDERDFAEVEEYAKAILEFTMKNPKVKEIVDQHAYKSTLLRRLLIEARASYGVISTSIFGWIAINNRVLFVSMSDEGMAESSVEAYAIAEHLRYERLLKRPVYEINIDRQATWIEYYLKKKGLIKS